MTASGVRVALVIGVGEYRSGRLRNPVRDAEAIADALKRIGFEVTALRDPTREEMLEGLRATYLRGRTASTRLVYFAGHGVQSDGQNFVLPVDFWPQDTADLAKSAVNLSQAIEAFSQLKEGVNIFILDACRESPLTRFGQARGERGLARMPAPRGTIVAFSTHPGGVAADTPQLANSLYTGHLLRHLSTPGLTVEEVFKRVREDVSRASRDRQVPWESSSLMGDYCFVSTPHGCGKPVR